MMSEQHIKSTSPQQNTHHTAQTMTIPIAKISAAMLMEMNEVLKG